MTHEDQMPRACITGTGRYEAERVVSNFDLEKMVDTSDEWITERTGISERRMVADGVLTSDMAAGAAAGALESAGKSPEEVDFIVVGTVTGDQPLPATAAFVQKKIGAGQCPAFDVSAACAGFIYGLSIADKFIRLGEIKCGIVVGVELLSRFLDFKDRNTCVLFGDGAGAVVVEPVNDTYRGVVCTNLYTDGQHTDILAIPGGGSRFPANEASISERLHFVKMNGREVFKVAVRNIASAANATLASTGLSSGEVDHVVMHQANMRIIDQVAQRLKIPLDKFVLNIKKYGNTSSASIPIALDEAARDGRFNRGDNILMAGLGGGMSWGSALVKW